jgi:hypothetical protein
LTLATALLPVLDCLVLGSKVAEMPNHFDWSFNLNRVRALQFVLYPYWNHKLLFLPSAITRLNTVSPLESSRTVFSCNWDSELLFLPSVFTRVHTRVNASSKRNNCPARGRCFENPFCTRNWDRELWFLPSAVHSRECIIRIGESSSREGVALTIRFAPVIGITNCSSFQVPSLD